MLCICIMKKKDICKTLTKLSDALVHVLWIMCSHTLWDPTQATGHFDVLHDRHRLHSCWLYTAATESFLVPSQPVITERICYFRSTEHWATVWIWRVRTWAARHSRGGCWREDKGGLLFSFSTISTSVCSSRWYRQQAAKSLATIEILSGNFVLKNGTPDTFLP